MGNNRHLEEKTSHDKAWEAIKRIDEALAEIERLHKATLERTSNWREEVATTGKD